MFSFVINWTRFIVNTITGQGDALYNNVNLFRSALPPGAFDALCDNLNSPAFESAVEANDEDINFLSQLMNSTILQSLVQVGLNNIPGMHLRVQWSLPVMLCFWSLDGIHV